MEFAFLCGETDNKYQLQINRVCKIVLGDVEKNKVTID